MLGSAIIRTLLKLLLAGGVLIGGAIGLWHVQQRWSEKARLIAENKRLEERNRHLQQFVSRLTSEKRAAEILVTEQTYKGEEIESTTLLFLEYARDGSSFLPPRFFTIKGNTAHIDSLVIKFDLGLLEKNDPLRGHSIVLFYRLFGDYQTPSDAHRIDEPGKPPVAYADQNISPEARAFEQELWQNFWRLAEDAKYRQQMGVRAAHGESPWLPFYPDRVYTLTLATGGGLSIVPRPMDGLLKACRDAILRQKGSAPHPSSNP